jgi:uncharacterized protein
MTIHENIKAGIPAALKARDEVTLRTYRSLVTMMTNEVVAKKRKPDEFLSDEDAIVVLKRAVNQRKDSIEQFTNAERLELAEPEQQELAIISTLLPAQLTDAEIEAIIKAKIEELGFSDKSQIGKFMGMIMKEFGGNADGTVVKRIIETLLD